MTTVISIQSAVAYGHAGNSAAVFPLQRLGVEVWPVHTVNFSNHTGYGSWRGRAIPAAEAWEIVQGINDRGVLGEVDALLCGYLGTPELGETILAAVDLVRAANPAAVFCADPVMGDVDTGFYAAPGIPEFWRDQVVAKADVMTPNLFELEFLVGRKVETLTDVVEAARELRAMGPGTVVVTSAGTDAQAATVPMVGVDGAGAWIVETPRLDSKFTGSGDLTTAVFLAHFLRDGDLARSLGATASATYSVLEATAGHGELRLVQAQEDLVGPRHVFAARPVAGAQSSGS